jgi:predicted transcriptional regulator
MNVQYAMVSDAPLPMPYKGLGSSVNVILGLLEDGKMKASDVQKYADYRTGLSILRQLLSVDIVNLEIEDSWRKTNWYELTPKGRKVALLLKEAQDIIDQS